MTVDGRIVLVIIGNDSIGNPDPVMTTQLLAIQWWPSD